MNSVYPNHVGYLQFHIITYNHELDKIKGVDKNEKKRGPRITRMNTNSLEKR